MAGIKGKTGVWKRTDNQKKQILQAGYKTRFIKGHKMSQENIEKMRKALIGKKKTKIYSGEKSPFWKGEKAGYRAIHLWMDKNFGKPKRCDICGSTEKQRYEWSTNGLYIRKRENWQRLCIKCHRKKDDWFHKVAIKTIYKKRRNYGYI